jgi:hypothetical protein
MTFISSEIGLARLHMPPPKASASFCGRNDQLIASFSPRAAAARRTLRSRLCCGVAVGLATPSARGSGVEAHCRGRRCARLLRPGRLAIDIAPPCRDSDRPVGCHVEAQRFQDGLLPVGRHIDAAQRRTARGVIGNRLALHRRLPGADNIARLAAAGLQDQVGEQRKAIVEESRIDTAFKPAARIRGQRQRLPGPGDASGVK